MGPHSRDLLATLTDRRPVRRRVPVRHQPADLAGLRDRAGDPDHLRRRTGLGALRARRVRGRRVRGPDGGGRRVRRRPRRLLRDRVDAAGEGLPRLRARTDPQRRTPSRPACCSPASSRPTSTFLGRAAVEKAKAEGPRRKLVGFSVDAPEAMLWGGELVLRDGVGRRPGHLGGVGRDGRLLRRAWPTCVRPTTPSSTPTG